MSSDLRFKNGNVNKEDDLLYLRVAILKNVFDNFETYSREGNKREVSYDFPKIFQAKLNKNERNIYKYSET